MSSHHHRISRSSGGGGPQRPAASPSRSPAKASPSPAALPAAIFECAEESALFSRGVRRFLAHEMRSSGGPLRAEELGPGDGVPVIGALAGLLAAARHAPVPVAVSVTAFESCPVAAASARRNVDLSRAALLPHTYDVRVGDFFSEAGAGAPPCPSSSSSLSFSPSPSPSPSPPLPSARLLLLANPPYLPAESPSGLLLPGLWGGRDGADVTRRLLSLPRYSAALLVVAGISAPRSVLRAARRAGYRVRAFEAEHLPFGMYTSQPEVRRWIARLDRAGLAHTVKGGGGGGGRGGSGGGGAGGGYVAAAVAFERGGNGNGSDGDANNGLEARLLDALMAKHWVDGELVV